MNLDYKLLAALSAVMEYQSFERAASALFITQSAISQRIKLLEELVGHSVLVRSKPLALTSIGAKLLGHYRNVKQLEWELLPELNDQALASPIKLSFAINADSVAVWFLPAINQMLSDQSLLELDILIASEGDTIEKLRSGEAFAGVCLQSQAINGFTAQYIGNMDYALVASEQFANRYFRHGITRKSLRQAPGVAFDPADSMHHKFIHQHFGLRQGDYPCHYVRSSEAFVDMATIGLGYCLIPELQISEQLASGQLVNLLPDKPLKMPLYWHSWVLSKGIYKQANQSIVAYARNRLKSLHPLGNDEQS